MTTAQANRIRGHNRIAPSAVTSRELSKLPHGNPGRNRSKQIASTDREGARGAATYQSLARLRDIAINLPMVEGMYQLELIMHMPEGDTRRYTATCNECMDDVAQW